MESNFFKNLLSENSTGAAIANVASVKVLKDIKIPYKSEYKKSFCKQGCLDGQVPSFLQYGKTRLWALHFPADIQSCHLILLSSPWLCSFKETDY